MEDTGDVHRGPLTLVAIFVAIHRIQPSLHNVVLASAAVCWAVSDGLWLVNQLRAHRAEHRHRAHPGGLYSPCTDFPFLPILPCQRGGTPAVGLRHRTWRVRREAAHFREQGQFLIVMGDPQKRPVRGPREDRMEDSARGSLIELAGGLVQ